MSGAMRAGLIFAAVGLIAILATAFFPRPGPVVCGPLLALLVGGLAGFFVNRRSRLSWTSGDRTCSSICYTRL